MATLLNEEYFGASYPPYSSTGELIQAVNSTLVTCSGPSYIKLVTQLDFWNNGVH